MIYHHWCYGNIIYIARVGDARHWSNHHPLFWGGVMITMVSRHLSYIPSVFVSQQPSIYNVSHIHCWLLLMLRTSLLILLILVCGLLIYCWVIYILNRAYFLQPLSSSLLSELISTHLNSSLIALSSWWCSHTSFASLPFPIYSSLSSSSSLRIRRLISMFHSPISTFIIILACFHPALAVYCVLLPSRTSALLATPDMLLLCYVLSHARTFAVTLWCHSRDP